MAQPPAEARRIEFREYPRPAPRFMSGAGFFFAQPLPEVKIANSGKD
jgi:hypothetical protein